MMNRKSAIIRCLLCAGVMFGGWEATHGEEPATRSATTSKDGADYSALTAKLNDFSNWTNGAGAWYATPQGHIHGEGDSTLVFNDPLPADCLVEFRMMVMDGMRARIFFTGSGAFIGNEGFSWNIFLHELNDVRGIERYYARGQEMRIGMKAVGETFELYINGELMGRGKRKTVPAQEGLRLSAGDGWSQGKVEYWDFKVSPVN